MFSKYLHFMVCFVVVRYYKTSRCSWL